MKNVVFYSKYKKDVNSPKLLSLIEQTPFKKDFIYCCIDPDPETKKRNEDLLFILDIKMVPTMYVNGEKYEGDQAMQWLQMAVGGGGQGTEIFQSGGGYEQSYPDQVYASQMQMQQQPQQYMPSMPQQPPLQSGGFTQMMPPQMPPQMPGGMGMGGPSLQSGGFGGGNMPPPQNGMSMPPQGTGGMMLQGGGGDSSYANPYMPNDVSGINNGGYVNPAALLTPMQTKNQDNGASMDQDIARMAAMRESQVPTPQTPSMMQQAGQQFMGGGQQQQPQMGGGFNGNMQMPPQMYQGR